mmetsp:Transcript_5943/g.11230  ORF Transcript_5943/g.11230 Transcript_5943/m.11230 type:complete len:320 (+) Transcript_5943:809-1768(+)|eukprot:CAMPEP_0176502470 /NCGR_PEP_ID=MMETSP0200_2-20121128/14773_1 /TAXON_ID=947934 /ORGANISM="Chaetoceros sp., Strain GSL56" /LENGTH=319 /DNA_ID=CAMNT_0017901549 /DNA_START=727 /DNA_END=1686 /DNA_ORIENTATION=+
MSLLPCSTQLECGCLTSWVLSGFDAANVSTYANVLDENTVQRYHLTGEWIGIDAITEYLSAYGGDFASSLQPLGMPKIDMSQTTEEECVLLNTGAARVFSKPEYSTDGVSKYIDFIGGGSFRFQLTGDANRPIYITNWDIWVPDEFIPALFGAIDSDATAEFVCDEITTICNVDESDSDDACGGKGKKCSRSLKSTKQKEGKKNKKAKKKMAKCLKKFQKLPANDDGFWIDGDSRHCRILHGFYARTNTEHCPHVTFEKELDVHGKCKCCESKKLKADDVFTQEELEFFKSIALPYDLPSESSNPYIQVYTEGSQPMLN